MDRIFKKIWYRSKWTPSSLIKSCEIASTTRVYQFHFFSHRHPLLYTSDVVHASKMRREKVTHFTAHDTYFWSIEYSPNCYSIYQFYHPGTNWSLLCASRSNVIDLYTQVKHTKKTVAVMENIYWVNVDATDYITDHGVNIATNASIMKIAATKGVVSTCRRQPRRENSAIVKPDGSDRLVRKVSFEEMSVVEWKTIYKMLLCMLITSYWLRNILPLYDLKRKCLESSIFLCVLIA